MSGRHRRGLLRRQRVAREHQASLFAAGPVTNTVGAPNSDSFNTGPYRSTRSRSHRSPELLRNARAQQAQALPDQWQAECARGQVVLGNGFLLGRLVSK
jgi:hypothetical protein